MKRLGSLLLVLCLLSSCGKKQKHMFFFDTTQKINVSPLDLPSIHGVRVTQGVDSVHISWHPVVLDAIKHQELSFQGYNVYRLTRAGIIPKKPIHKKILIETSFVDMHAESKTAGYLVRAVFAARKQVFQGPASRIVRLMQA